MANVLFGSNIEIDFNNISGIAKKLAWQAKAFSEITGDIAYCQYVNDGKLVICKPDFEIVDIEPIKSGLFQRKRRYKALTDWALEHKVRFLYYRFDHYDPIMHTFFKKMKNSGAKIVLELPTYPYDAERNDRHRRLLSQGKFIQFILHKCFVLLEKVTILKAKCVIDGIVTYMPYKSIWGIPVTVIDNGVDVDEVPLAKSTFHNDDELTLLCVANLSIWHGLDRLIKGIKESNDSCHENLKLRIASPDTEEARNLKNLVSTLKLEDKVIFLGPVTGGDLDHLFDSSDIAIGSLGLHRIGLTSGSTLKLKEYCARGLPFIYSYEEKQLDGDEPFALKFPSNDDAISMSEIIDFCNRLKEQEGISLTMRQFATERFSWKTQMKIIVEKYFKS